MECLAQWYRVYACERSKVQVPSMLNCAYLSKYSTRLNVDSLLEHSEYDYFVFIRKKDQQSLV